MSGDTFASFREHRTREELDGLLHYAHFIPVSRGFHDDYVAEHYPGWTWNELIYILRTAGVVIDRGGTPPMCDPRVRAVHWTDATTFAVEWEDSSPTVGP